MNASLANSDPEVWVSEPSTDYFGGEAQTPLTAAEDTEDPAPAFATPKKNIPKSWARCG